MLSCLDESLTVFIHETGNDLFVFFSSLLKDSLASGICGKIQPSGAQNTVFDAWETSKMCSTNILHSCCNFICGLLSGVELYFRQSPVFPWDRRCWSVSATGCYNNKYNQSLFVLILAKEQKKFAISMKILKVIIWVLAAWNNHRGYSGPRQPSWSFDASDTGESTKCPWVQVVGSTPTHRHFVLSLGFRFISLFWPSYFFLYAHCGLCVDA